MQQKRVYPVIVSFDYDATDIDGLEIKNTEWEAWHYSFHCQLEWL